MTRIVITGMGTINALGHNVEDTWNKLKSGRSGVGLITRCDTSEVETKIGAEVKDFDPVARFGVKEARRMDRFAQFAIVAAQEALAQSGYVITPENTFDTGVVISAGFGGPETLSEGFDTFRKFGLKKVKPTSFPLTLSNMGPAQTAMAFGIKGINFSMAAACATSAISIGEGAEIIKRGDASVVLAGGTEAGFASFVLAGLNAMRALSTNNSDPEGASRPFDKERDGFVPAEGSAVVILESLEHAQARGAKILAELVGYSATCDALHVSAPDSEGTAIAYAMRRALGKAGITINDIDYINAHGTSTQLNDTQETRVVKQVFGERAYEIPISSTKSMTGHAMSTSGALEAIVSIKVLHDNILPPTINYHHPDPTCDLDYVPNTSREVKNTRYIMSNSFGFGGQNAILILKRWENGNSAHQ